MIERDNTTINSNLVSRSLLEEQTIFNIGKSEFIVGAGGVHQNETLANIFWDPRFYTVKYTQHKKKYNKIGGTLTQNEANVLGNKA